MNFDEIAAQWRAQPAGEVNPPAVAALARHLERRQKGRLAVHSVCLAITVASIVWTLAMLARNGGAVESWPALMVQLLAFGILLAMVRRRAALMRRSRMMGGDGLSVLRQSLAESAAHVRDMAWATAAMGIFSVLLALAVRGLVESGKMRPHDAMWMGILGGAIVVANLGYFLWTYLRRVRPRRERLRQLIGQHSGDSM